MYETLKTSKSNKSNTYRHTCAFMSVVQYIDPLQLLVLCVSLAPHTRSLGAFKGANYATMGPRNGMHVHIQLRV